MSRRSVFTKTDGEPVGSEEHVKDHVEPKAVRKEWVRKEPACPQAGRSEDAGRAGVRAPRLQVSSLGQAFALSHSRHFWMT